MIVPDDRARSGPGCGMAQEAQEAAMGTWSWIGVGVLALAGAALALHAYGERRWQRATQELRLQLEASRQGPAPARLQQGELDALPPPVQRYLRAALPAEAAMVATIDLVHKGRFDIREEGQRWLPFESRQRVQMRRPGFVWDARMPVVPGLAVHVHDAYIAGEGVLHPSVAGLVSLAEQRSGGDFARDELMRFLAESPWYPTALLPSQGVRWLAIDEGSARATLVDGPHEVSLVFVFGADGMVESVRAAARGRSLRGQLVPTPWEGRWQAYETRCGMRVPTRGEVAWLLPEGGKPYWRGQLVEMRCAFAE